MDLKANLSAEVRSTVTAASRVKANLSGLLFGSAVLFEGHARAIERAAEGTPDAPLDHELDEHRAYVLGGVIAVAAAIEASINEFFADVEDRNQDKVGRILDDARAVSTMCELWPQIESLPVLQKYQTALTLCGFQQFDLGAAPYQDAESVVKLRNALMHFKPEWDDERDVHQSLERRLQGKFNMNPMLSGALVWFPHRCLSAACLAWAIASAQRFVNEFSAKLGIKERLVPYPPRK